MYFGNFVTTTTTILLLIELGYIVNVVRKQKDIKNCGRQTAFIALCGLILCCFVATRDNYHLSVQAAIDGSVNPGIFTIDSIQSTICCIGGAVISFSILSSLFIKKQKYRKAMFLLLSATVIIKTAVIELSRWML